MKRVCDSTQPARRDRQRGRAELSRVKGVDLADIFQCGHKRQKVRAAAVTSTFLCPVAGSVLKQRSGRRV